jgi:NDP-sugar pyrophosphorylase family protein
MLATLAVQDRAARRRLLFDERGLLGWESRGADGPVEAARRVREPIGALRDWAFAGIHVVEPELLGLTDRKGTFALWDLYLDLAARGYVVQSADVSAHEWMDVGTTERLRAAEEASW